MTTKEKFIKLVGEMREAQISYFKYRGSEMLTKSKALEREVDKMIFGFKLVARHNEHNSTNL